jgi:hypothetical protein
MSAAKTIVENYLRTLRSFYPTDKPYYQQRRMLIHALTLPARWLDESGV